MLKTALNLKLRNSLWKLRHYYCVIMTQWGGWSLVIGHWSLVIGHWSLVIGHWSLVIGHWSFRAKFDWAVVVLKLFK
jgi:hypothetical protein